jgi:hypothetical protein
MKRTMRRMIAIVATGVAAIVGADRATAAGAPLNYPTGVAVDQDENIYVANTNANTVNIYGKGYKLLRSLTAGVTEPTAVAVTPTGRIYVGNVSRVSSVTAYNPDGTPDVEHTFDVAFLPKSAFADELGELWMLDASGTAHVFLDDNSEAGRLVLPGAEAMSLWQSSLVLWGAPNGTVRGTTAALQANAGAVAHNDSAGAMRFASTLVIDGAAADAEGNLYLSDQIGLSIDIVDAQFPTGSPLIHTASPPGALAIDNRAQRLYVAEPNANQVEVFSLKAPYGLLHTIR